LSRLTDLANETPPGLVASQVLVGEASFVVTGEWKIAERIGHLVCHRVEAIYGSVGRRYRYVVSRQPNQRLRMNPLATSQTTFVAQPDGAQSFGPRAF
jgi:hypothetical protein